MRGKKLLEGISELPVAAGIVAGGADLGTVFANSLGLTQAAATHVFAGSGVLFSLYALGKFAKWRATNKGQEDVEARIGNIVERINDLHENAEAEASRSQAALEAVQEDVDFHSLPPELRSDLQAGIAAYFDAKQEERIAMVMEVLGQSRLRDIQVQSSRLLKDLPDGPLKQAIEEDRREAERLRNDSCRSLHDTLQAIYDASKITLDIRLDGPSRSADQTGPQRLLYTEAFVPLIGRDRERELLRDFRDYDPNDKVRWWLLFGEGGMGKSRLAQELIEESLGSWQGGFLRSDFPDPAAMAKWRPTAPTILVIDYAQTRAANCREAIAALYRNRDLLEHPVRILLLERRYVPTIPWSMELWGDRSASTQLQVRDCMHTEPLQLKQLDFDDFERAFFVAYRNICGTPFPPEHLEAAKAYFTHDDFKERRYRPLYAGLCAMKAVSEGTRSMRDWDPNDLEEYVLRHEQHHWAKHGIGQDDLNAVFVATMLGGLSIGQLRDLQSEEGVKEALEARAKAVCSHSDFPDTITVPSLEPDLLGEAFVRLRLKGRFSEGSDETVKDASRRLWHWAHQEGLA